MYILDLKSTSILSAKRYPSLRSPLPPNHSLNLTEPAVDDFARAKHVTTIGQDLARADWIWLRRLFAAAQRVYDSLSTTLRVEDP